MHVKGLASSITDTASLQQKVVGLHSPVELVSMISRRQLRSSPQQPNQWQPSPSPNLGPMQLFGAVTSDQLGAASSRSKAASAAQACRSMA